MGERNSIKRERQRRARYALCLKRVRAGREDKGFYEEGVKIVRCLACGGKLRGEGVALIGKRNLFC